MSWVTTDRSTTAVVKKPNELMQFRCHEAAGCCGALLLLCCSSDGNFLFNSGNSWHTSSSTTKNIVNNFMAANENEPGMAKVVERNIAALLERRRREEQRKGLQDRIADRITCFAGSMSFVYIHLVLFGLWLIWNSGLLGLPRFDPSFVVLAMFASVEAIFLSTFVLITQNRMNAQADKRAELDLQISLLTEHEVTKLITLVSAMARKLEVENADDAELDELARDVRPESVMDTLERADDSPRDKNA